MIKLLLAAAGGAIFATVALVAWFIWYFKDMWK